MPPTLTASAKIQARVIGALIVRESLTRFGRHNIGFLWLFFEPMLFTLGVTALWTFSKAGHGSHLPIAAFALTGYSSVLLWRSMPSRCITAIEPNLSLLFHKNVRLIDLFLARIALEAIGTTMSFAILSIVFYWFGLLDLPEDILSVLAGWGLLGWFGAALGLLLGALAWENEIVDKIWHPFSYLIFPLSGAGFILNAVPPSGRDVIMFLPMVHGVEFLREGWFGSRIIAHYDLGYMALCNTMITLIAIIRIRQITNKVKPT